MEFMLESSVFKEGDLIPSQYTCDGKDLSPPLTWSNAPPKTQSFVLIVDDPDAPGGTWDHWLLFNIPFDARELKANCRTLPPGTQRGKNSWGRNDYGGPCPPDSNHRYFFKIYALSAQLDLPDGATKEEIQTAMQGCILASYELMGRYERIRK